MDIRFNVNWPVRVKLTEFGVQVYRSSWTKYGLVAPPPPKADKDGYSKFALHDLMSHFGEVMAVGFDNLPFATDIILEVEE